MNVVYEHCIFSKKNYFFDCCCQVRLFTFASAMFWLYIVASYTLYIWENFKKFSNFEKIDFGRMYIENKEKIIFSKKIYFFDHCCQVPVFTFASAMFWLYIVAYTLYIWENFEKCSNFEKIDFGRMYIENDQYCTLKRIFVLISAYLHCILR